MKKIILSIDGMTCSACSSGLEKYLNKQDGISNALVNLVMANAAVEYDEKILDQEKIEEFIKQAGFKSLGIFKEIKDDSKSKKDKILFIVYTLLAIILMYISMGHMINLPIIFIFDPHVNAVNYVIILCLLAISFIVYGFDIIRNGYKNLIHRTPNMDTLVSIGVICSFLYSLYNMYLVFIGNHDLAMNLYFESSAIVIYFVKLGRYIDRLSKDKTKDAIKGLVNLAPNTATIRSKTGKMVVTIDEIKISDIVISRVGEKIAVDGKVISGDAHIDESFITGESRPVTKSKGDRVIAGSINCDGYIEYEAEKIGKESTISEIVKLVVEATNTKPKISKIADKVSGYFVPIVIIIAIIAFVLYLIITRDFNVSLTTFVTILVVACPCSLGLATPLAVVVSEGVCALNGILVKKSEILERAKNVDTIVFDKTGTLTYGKLKISTLLNYSNLDEDRLLQIVGSLESKSTHPISKCFTSYLEEKKLELLDVSDFKNISGYGIIGKINNDEVIIGNSKLLKKYKINNQYLSEEEKLASYGNSIVYVVINKKIVSIIGVNDIIRDNSKEVISILLKNNIDIVMLTGDNSKTAEEIAEKLGIKKVIANVLPIEKSNIIKQLKNEKRFVMMCGDGINDSLALTNSDIGVSINNGNDIAMDSSDVILTKNDLNSIISLISISKKTIKIIKQNLFWAFFYNLIMIPIAIGVLKPLGITITPMIASFAMVLSSITVIINTLRLRKQIS